MSQYEIGGRGFDPEFDADFGPRPQIPINHPGSNSTHEERGRREFTSAEVIFRRAGTIGMVLGVLVFVTFAIPVSGMLHEAGGLGAILEDRGWLWKRWVARMAVVLGFSGISVVMCWGLRQFHSWARIGLILLGLVPPLALVVGIGFQNYGTAPAHKELATLMTMPVVGLFVYPASLGVLWASFSRRSREAFGPVYRFKMTGIPQDSYDPVARLLGSLGLIFSILVLNWILLMASLSFLATCGVICKS